MPNQPRNTSIASLTGLSFPLDIGNYGFWMSFEFKEYIRDSVLLGGTILGSGMNVNLPMPDTINDHQVVVWQSESLTKEAVGSIDKLKESIDKVLPGAGKALGAAGDVASLAGSLYSWKQGVTINPFLIMLFKEPTFKEFTFSWYLYPRSADESDALNNIVRSFRKNMLPSTGGSIAGLPLGPLVLKYPMIVKPSFNPEQYLFRFKHCAIKDININFTGAGMPSFTVTQAPTAVKLDISLTEIDLWFADDPDLVY